MYLVCFVSKIFSSFVGRSGSTFMRLDSFVVVYTFIRSDDLLEFGRGHGFGSVFFRNWPKQSRYANERLLGQFRKNADPTPRLMRCTA